jgi:hypothetical protein
VPRIGSSADVGYRGLVVDDANNEKFTVAGRRTQLEGELFGIGFTNPMAAADYRDAPDRTALSNARHPGRTPVIGPHDSGSRRGTAKTIFSYSVEQGRIDVLTVSANSDRSTPTPGTAPDSSFEARGFNASKPPEFERYTNSMITTLAAPSPIRSRPQG